jgi:hypothetical protein
MADIVTSHFPPLGRRITVRLQCGYPRERRWWSARGWSGLESGVRHRPLRPQLKVVTTTRQFDINVDKLFPKYGDDPPALASREPFVPRLAAIIDIGRLRLGQSANARRNVGFLRPTKGFPTLRRSASSPCRIHLATPLHILERFVSGRHRRSQAEGKE